MLSWLAKVQQTITTSGVKTKSIVYTTHGVPTSPKAREDPPTVHLLTLEILLLLASLVPGLESLLNLLSNESQLLQRFEHLSPPTTRTLLGPTETFTWLLILVPLAARTTYPKFPTLMTTLQRMFPNAIEAMLLESTLLFGGITLTLLGCIIILMGLPRLKFPLM